MEVREIGLLEKTRCCTGKRDQKLQGNRADLGRNHCCGTRKLAIGSLSLKMASRDECRWVVLCRGVDFNSFGTPRCMDKGGQEDRDEWTKLKICPEDRASHHTHAIHGERLSVCSSSFLRSDSLSVCLSLTNLFSSHFHLYSDLRSFFHVLRSAYELSKAVTLCPDRHNHGQRASLGRTLTLRQW